MEQTIYDLVRENEGMGTMREMGMMSDMRMGIMEEKEREEKREEKWESVSYPSPNDQRGRWSLLISLVLIVILLILTCSLLIAQISSSPFFQKLGYPSWAPNGLTMILLGYFTFFFIAFSFIFFASYYIPFVLSLYILEAFFILTFLFFTYSTGLLSISTCIIVIAIILEIYVICYLAGKSVGGLCFHIPYLIYLIILFCVVLTMAIYQ